MISESKLADDSHSSSRKHHSILEPLWSHSQTNVKEADGRDCTPNANTVEPDVGILSCEIGYTCMVSDLSINGGICVPDPVPRSLQYAVVDYCAYYRDSLDNECDCSNCKCSAGKLYLRVYNIKSIEPRPANASHKHITCLGVENVGTFACSYKVTNLTYVGIPVDTTLNIGMEATTGGPRKVNLTVCHDAILPIESFSGYCVSQIVTYENAEAIDSLCTGSLNGVACDSCAVGCANVTNIPRTLNCENVNVDAVVDDFCDGDTMFKALFDPVAPTAEPTEFPTFEPTATALPSTGGIGKKMQPSVRIAMFVQEDILRSLDYIFVVLFFFTATSEPTMASSISPGERTFFMTAIPWVIAGLVIIFN